MTKRPNKLGRIEGEPKVKKSLPWKKIGKTLAILALVALGVLSTLAYQQTIRNIHADGVAEYKASKCKEFTDKNVTWLECDER